MVHVPAQSKILVTGASGFIGSNVTESFLRRGFSVRGTVRSESKGKYLDNLFAKYKTSWEWVIVTDVEEPGGFSEAVKDVDGIAHLASPFHFQTASDPYATIINPAVNGTLSILRAAKQHGDKVKRVVITSSYSAIINPSLKAPATTDEDTWNVEDPKTLGEQGKDTSGGTVYNASKTLAERAAWDFIDKEKPTFDLVTLQPPLVFGPIIHDVKEPSSLNTSVKRVWERATGVASIDDAATRGGNMVDVRDLAQAHVQALTVPEAGGNRFAISCKPYTWQDVLDSIADAIDKSPNMKTIFNDFKPGRRGAGKEHPAIRLVNEKSRKILRIKYTSFEDTIADTVEALAERAEKEWKINGHT